MSISAADSLTDFFEDFRKPEAAAELKKYMMAFGGLVLAAAVIYIASTDPKAKTDNFYLYTIFVILPVIIGVMIVSPLFSGPMDVKKMYLFGGIFFTFLMAMYFFYRIMNPAAVSAVTNIMTGLSFLGVIIGLAILYRVFIRAIINSRGWIGFFLKVLFLIPCLLIDAMETLFTELKSAPRMIVVLFVLEILIVLAYLYLPRLFKMVPSNSIVLLDKPVFTSKKEKIGTVDKFKMNKEDVNNPGKDSNAIRRHYSMSMWIYINQHPTSNAAYSKETDIFRYGVINMAAGNPRLTHSNDTKIRYIRDTLQGSADPGQIPADTPGTKNTDKPSAFGKYLLYPTNANPDKYIILDFPAQSWNHLVISYAETSVDVFVNGSLVNSYPLSVDELPSYSELDIVEVGDGDNTVTNGGLHGAICNVVYHKTPLSAFEVAADYNLNRYNNPPTHNTY